MGAKENLEMHVRWAEAENSHYVTVERWREFVHDDIVITHLDGTVVDGIEAMVRNMNDSINSMDNWRNVIEDRFATDDRIVCRWRCKGIPHDTGVENDIRGTSVWEVEDGRVRRGWICSNAAYQILNGVRSAGYFAINAHSGSAYSGQSG